MQADGREVAALEDQPVMAAHVWPAYELFWLLSSARAAGFSAPNPISIIDVLAGSREYGLEPLYFLRISRQADQAFIEHAVQQSKKKT
jgi:hypothetical protein